MKLDVKIKKLRDNFVMPKKAHASDAGFDLAHAGEEVISIDKGCTAIIPCGFSMEFSEGYEAQVRPRSGLAAKQSITVLNSPGTIDPSYRGEVMVILHNAGSDKFVIKPGARIAQLVMSKLPEVTFTEVKDLEDSDRGEAGFGSTGV